jgi:hypothetical protein
MMVMSATEDVHEDTAAGSKAAAPEADAQGIPDSPNTHSVVDVESSSPSSSLSLSSSSSTD